MHKVEFKVYKRERVPYAPHNCMILGVKMERVASLLYLFHFIGNSEKHTKRIHYKRVSERTEKKSIPKKVYCSRALFTFHVLSRLDYTVPFSSALLSIFLVRGRLTVVSVSAALKFAVAPSPLNNLLYNVPHTA